MSLINNILGKLFGNKSEKDIKEILPIAQIINEEYSKLLSLSNDELREKTKVLKKKVADYVKDAQNEVLKLKDKIEKEDIEIQDREIIYDKIDKIEKDIDNKLEDILNEILPEVFSLVKETAKRFVENEKMIATATDFDKELASTRDSVEIQGDKVIYYNKWLAGGNEIIWDMVHYDVQLIGGVVLHQGKIAEMATGEGKTVVATLPVFLNALTGRGVHIVTVNDYLAKRDCEWMGPIYEFHGLSVDCIDRHQPNSDARKKAYLAAVTFGTNNEFGFDYLRDNMKVSAEQLAQGSLEYAIIDEVDSILIDEARTPLIISGPALDDVTRYKKADGVARQIIKMQAEIDKLKDTNKHIMRRAKAAESDWQLAERELIVLKQFLDEKAGLAKVSADNENYCVPITIKEIEQILKG